jgi:hypothetical protein
MEFLIFTIAVLTLVLLGVLTQRFGVDSRPSISDTHHNW